MLKEEINEIKMDIEDMQSDLYSHDECLVICDEEIVQNRKKIDKHVRKQNKMEKQLNNFIDTYNENLAKQTLIIENLKRLYKVLLFGVIFIALILIACI